jgi:PASTA domain
VLAHRTRDAADATQVLLAAPPDHRGLRSWLLVLGLLVFGGVVGASLAVRHNLETSTPAPATTPARTAAPATPSARTAPANHPATRRETSRPAAGLAVPDVRGDKLSDAQKAIRRAGLVAEVRVVSSSLPKHTVVAQSPGSGATAARGDQILLTVSLGTKDEKGNGRHRGQHKHEEGNKWESE